MNNFFQTRAGNDFLNAVLTINKSLKSILESLQTIAEATKQKADTSDKEESNNEH